ncbi:hypothetical protein FHW96_005016 [Novosphingobium sp. SG751A]|uniref:hypothetical protein n=1 Tax=Novosphingobium sp. SG751A TaxID=2587000 RepID=UPI0020A63830|nr:hypothetical protein [Novosphingobium sp. SG751A]NOW48826.1 hypothetical protein [Novosphingobium sp. SG751A]
MTDRDLVLSAETLSICRQEAHLDLNHIQLAARDAPLIIAWPSPGLPGGMIQFNEPDEWRRFIVGLGIDARIPDIVQLKFRRAQALYLLGWIDLDVLKAGELAALIALELTVMDRYGDKIPKKKRSFAALLEHMVDVDGLDDAHIPMIVRTGGTAIGFVTGASKPSLSQRRNGMAHGDPFDGLPVGGLLELVRDLINYAYRDFIANTPVGRSSALLA